MVKAMEYIVRNVNNEDFIMPWLSVGVADGDIKYGDLSADAEADAELDYYIEDENLSDLMNLFLYTMRRASKDGGLYCDGVVSRGD